MNHFVEIFHWYPLVHESLQSPIESTGQWRRVVFPSGIFVNGETGKQWLLQHLVISSIGRIWRYSDSPTLEPWLMPHQWWTQEGLAHPNTECVVGWGKQPGAVVSGFNVADSPAGGRQRIAATEACDHAAQGASSFTSDENLRITPPP